MITKIRRHWYGPAGAIPNRNKMKEQALRLEAHTLLQTGRCALSTGKWGYPHNKWLRFAIDTGKIEGENAIRKGVGRVKRAILAITMGDPASIGPELSVKALGDAAIYAKCRPLIIGDACVMEQDVYKRQA